MNVIINEQYRLVKFDEKNFVLQEWRLPKECVTNKGKERKEKWINTGHYFQSVSSTLVWLLDHCCINDPGEYSSLVDAIEAIQKIKNELKNVEVK